MIRFVPKTLFFRFLERYRVNAPFIGKKGLKMAKYRHFNSF
jgi:hypothetical protein